MALRFPASQSPFHFNSNFKHLFPIHSFTSCQSKIQPNLNQPKNSLFSLPPQTNKPTITNTTSQSQSTMSSSSSTSPSLLHSESSDLAMALSLLSLDKENTAPCSSTASTPFSNNSSDLFNVSPVNEGWNKNRKRKRKGCPDCWFRVPLEDITHLFHPNINGNGDKVVMPPNTSPLRLDTPVEKKVVVSKRRGLNLKPVEMKTRVCLRKEFR